MIGIKAPLSCDFEAGDLINSPADRVQATISRIARNIVLSERVKEMHQWKCQICGYTITGANGLRYAEVHHIGPLGSPHNGPDVIENTICVCPNHHAECDRGAIRLDLKAFREGKVVEHRISQEFIDYHNRSICRDLGHERRRNSTDGVGRGINLTSSATRID